MQKQRYFMWIVCAAFTAIQSVFPCTGFVAGKNATADGSRIIARTEDLDGAQNKLFVVYPRSANASDSFFEDPTGFKIELPKIRYKYTGICDANRASGIYDAAGFNEFGVAMSATVSAAPGAAALKYDPLVKTGLSEASIVTVVLPYVKTAREAVKRTAEIIDVHGSAEGNILFFADAEEIWYMEILSGHQYAAVKVPEDSYAIVPNHFLLGYVDIQSPDVVASAALISLPKAKKFYKEKDGLFHVALTYADHLGDYERDRLWGGQNKLSPSKKIDYDTDVFSLWQKADKKIKIKDIMELQRYRYEDTKLNANLKENEDIRAIGHPTSMECHIIQIKNKMPADIGGIMWLAMANAEHSVYLPFYANIDDTIAPYKVDDSVYNPDSFYWTMRSINVLAALDREKFGKNIRKFWSVYEDSLIKAQNKKDKELIKIYEKSGKEAAAAYATMLCSEQAQDAFEKACRIYRDLITYIAGNEGIPKQDPFTPDF
ncbi:C69 family dipeptidase [Treponema sp. OMZ 840]|uniref:C69 family dipeptidase n=1 Tax=Treponema sp. OMZ 840 TaxID=244313 RepID=UPI003D8B39DF